MLTATSSDHLKQETKTKDNRVLWALRLLPRKNIKRKTSHEKGSSPLEFQLPPFQSDLDDEDDESIEEDFLDFVKETAGAMNVQKIFSDLAENESVIDPETGMLMNTGKL